MAAPSSTWPRHGISSCDRKYIHIEFESYSEATSDSSSILSSVIHSDMSSTTSSASSPSSEASRNTLLTEGDQDNISTSADSSLTSISRRCNGHTDSRQAYQLLHVRRTGITHIANSSNFSNATSDGDLDSLVGSIQSSPCNDVLHHCAPTTTKEPEEESTGKVTSKKSRRCLKISLALIIFVGISAGVAVATLLLISNKSTVPPVFTEAEMTVRVINETFQDAMMESTSSEFRDFGGKFCTNVLSALTGKVNDARCQVHTLRPGSIVVNFTLELLAPENVTLHLLEQWLRVATLGVMTLDPSSLRILSNASEREFHLTQDQPSSCSAELLPLQPLSYTFPHHCQDYQVCVDGTPRLEKCQDGQEFAYTSPENEVVCAPPSPLTYCGQKRRQAEIERATTTTTTIITITTTTTTAITTTTATMATTSQDLTSSPTTAPTLPLFSSTPVDTRTLMIMSPTKSAEGVLSTLDGASVSFVCPRTGQHFLPAVDTYPSNCGKYQHCNNGHSYNMTCPAGLMYIYAEYVCNSVQDPRAFCNLMENGISRAI